MGAKQKNLTGKKYNRLSVLELSESRDYGGSKKRMWLCKCDCGNIFKVNTSAIIRGNTKSCGCLRDEKSKDNSINSRHKLARLETGAKVIFGRYKKNAETRKYNFDLEYEYFKKIISQNCFYCNAKPTNYYSKSFYKFTYNGIDRINNTIGYTASNIVPCCKFCNIAKNNNNINDFLNWIKNISDNYKNVLKKLELNDKNM